MKQSITSLRFDVGRVLQIFGSRLIRRLLAALILVPGWAMAQTSTDWGIIQTDTTYTYTFSNSDITKPFTDTYSFTLSGTEGTQYQMNLLYDSCTRGCGNMTIDYGIYQGGNLIDTSGSTVLTSGTYELKVSGTGMGSGNDVTYSGSITFTPMVAPVPEPSEVLLFLVSAGLLAWSLLRQRRQQRLLLAA